MVGAMWEEALEMVCELRLRETMLSAPTKEITTRAEKSIFPLTGFPSPFFWRAVPEGSTPQRRAEIRGALRSIDSFRNALRADSVHQRLRDGLEKSNAIKEYGARDKTPISI